MSIVMHMLRKALYIGPICSKRLSIAHSTFPLFNNHHSRLANAKLYLICINVTRIQAANKLNVISAIMHMVNQLFPYYLNVF